MPESNSDDEPDPSEYTFSGAERRYITSGEVGGYREAVLEERVEQRVAMLGDRIDLLLHDVSLLDQKGHLDGEPWHDAWFDFAGFDTGSHTPDLTRRDTFEFEIGSEQADATELIDACTPGMQPGTGSPTSLPAEVAADIGRMMWQIMVTPEGLERETVMKEVVWGFIRGFYMDQRPANECIGDARRELMDGLNSFLTQRADKVADADEDTLELLNESREASRKWSAKRQGMKDIIRDILNAHDVPLKRPSAWKEAFEESDNTDSTEERGGVEPSEVLDLLTDYLVDSDAIDEDDPFVNDTPGTQGQLIQFQRQYGPVEEFEPSDVVTPENVLTVVSEYNLVSKGQLQPLVEDDAERIEDKSWRGIEAADVVDTIAESEGEAKSSTIAMDIRQNDDKGSVTALCRDLEGREFERPVLMGDKTGWRLTAYGELVAQTMFNGTPFGPLGVGDVEKKAALVEGAADEIGVETRDYSPEE